MWWDRLCDRRSRFGAAVCADAACGSMYGYGVFLHFWPGPLYGNGELQLHQMMHVIARCSW